MSWLVLYFAASIITFRCYADDKKAAQNSDSRTPELALHLMSLLGGWPGAVIAQVLLRHKTRKPSFLLGYWSTVVFNCIGLGLVLWKGVWPLKLILEGAGL